MASNADVNAALSLPLQNRRPFEQGWTTLFVAVHKGYKEVVELLLAKKADVNGGGGMPLLLAVANGDKDMVKLLLANKADVNAKAGDGDTPLHLAVKDGNSQLAIYVGRLRANSSDYRDVVELLLANKAEVNATNSYGWTPLHFAADRGHTNVVELLSQHGGTNDMKPSPPLRWFGFP